MNAVRAGICGLITFEVLAFGGVLPWTEGVLEIGAAGLFLLWGTLAIQRKQADVHWNWLYLPLLGLGVLALAQYVSRRSVYPYLTKVELLKWGACVLLFFLATEAFHRVEQANAFAWFLIVLGFGISLFGLVQYFTFNGKLYWSFPLSHGGEPFGPYVNRDHFAGFVELTAPLGLGLLFFRTFSTEQTGLLLLFTVVPIGALALSSSRGGIVGFCFELILLLFLSRAHRFEKKQLLAATALSLFAGIFLVWLGAGEAIHRFQRLRPGDISRDRRVSIYRDTWQIFTNHPWAGTGLGTFIVVYPQYQSVYDGLRVDHAHNDYLELLAETGVAGGFCGLAFVVILLTQGLRNVRRAEGKAVRAIYAGAFAGCSGLLVHSLVDFNLHIPSNALIFVLLTSVATSKLIERDRREGPDKVHATEVAAMPQGA